MQDSPGSFHQAKRGIKLTFGRPRLRLWKSERSLAVWLARRRRRTPCPHGRNAALGLSTNLNGSDPLDLRGGYAAIAG